MTTNHLYFHRSPSSLKGKCGEETQNLISSSEATQSVSSSESLNVTFSSSFKISPLHTRSLFTIPETNSSSNESTHRLLLNRSLMGEEGKVYVEEKITTNFGDILVSRLGNPSHPALITYHDLGLTHITNFQTFFSLPENAVLIETFCIYHITAPGQEIGASTLPEGFVYPTIEELSLQVEYVLHYYGIVHCIGLGCGLGANVLVRLAHRRYSMIHALILINCNSQVASWSEWLYHKMNVKAIRKSLTNTLPDSVIEYFVWYYMGRSNRSLESTSLSSIYKQHFSSSKLNSFNLTCLLESYIKRSDLGLRRKLGNNGKSLLGSLSSLRLPVLSLCGSESPHINDSIIFNSQLLPNQTSWLKISGVSMVLEEKPSKASEAVKYFLQGLGYALYVKGPSSESPLKGPHVQMMMSFSST